MQRALDFRTALLQSGGCAFTAEVTADYGEQVYRFTMDCTWSPDGGAALTLTAPQTLEGIRAEVSADGARVVYEDTAVGFESLAGGRLAPMALPYSSAYNSQKVTISSPEWNTYRSKLSLTVRTFCGFWNA